MHTDTDTHPDTDTDTETANGTATDPSDMSLGGQVGMAVVAALIIAVYAVHVALPLSTFSLPTENKSVIRSLAPQGWAFFTKSPRSPEPVAYGLRPSSGWHNLNAGPQAVPSTAMGLNRRGRSQGTELAILMQQVPSREWTTCAGEITACLDRLTARSTITNFTSHQTICGQVGLAVQEVLPWAWRGLPTHMPSKITRVVVTC